jgi:hypothetical protein
VVLLKPSSKPVAPNPPPVVAPAPPAPPPAPMPPKPAVVVPAGPHKIPTFDELKPLADWNRKWTFEKGAPPDLIAGAGKWVWNGDKNTMDVAGYVDVCPAYLLPSDNLLFTAETDYLDAKKTTRNQVYFFRKEGDQISSLQSKGWARDKTFIGLHTVRKVYLYHGRTIGMIDDMVCSIGEFSMDFKDAIIVLGFENLAVHNIVVRPLKEEEVPDFVKNPEPLKKDMYEIKTDKRP